MSDGTGKWSVLFFCIKFVVFVSVLVVLWWWLLLPYYAQFLLQGSGVILKYLLKMPLESGFVVVDGVCIHERPLALY
jgi:hypothetical protein